MRHLGRRHLRGNGFRCPYTQRFVQQPQFGERSVAWHLAICSRTVLFQSARRTLLRSDVRAACPVCAACQRSAGPVCTTRQCSAGPVRATRQRAACPVCTACQPAADPVCTACQPAAADGDAPRVPATRAPHDITPNGHAIASGQYTQRGTCTSADPNANRSGRHTPGRAVDRHPARTGRAISCDRHAYT